MASEARPEPTVTQAFRAHPSSLHQIRNFVRQQAGTAGLSSEAAEDLVLAVSEACANSIVHTNTFTIRVAFGISGHGAKVEILDQGVFQRQLPVPDLEATGRGIPLMVALMDEVTIREGTPGRPGTLVRLIKRDE